MAREVSTFRSLLLALLTVALAATALPAPAGAAGLTVDDVARLRYVTSARMSPDGALVAYTLSVPRDPYDDEDGRAWSELWVAGPGPGRSRGFVTGEVSVSSISWTPGGTGISFLSKRGDDEHPCLYVIPVDGGEAREKACFETGIDEYSLSPDGSRVAFLAEDKKPELEEKKEKKGFKAKVIEEQLVPVKVRIAPLGDEPAGKDDITTLDLPGSASGLHWSPAGDRLAVALAPTPLIDDEYMKRRIHVVDVESGEVVTDVDTEGKLGDVRWSPDGQRLAFIGAADLNDPNAGRLMVAGVEGGRPLEVMEYPDGDFLTVEWKDAGTVAFTAAEGVETWMGEFAFDGRRRTVRVETGGPILGSLSLSADGSKAAFAADSPLHPSEVYVLGPGDPAPVRWTDSNPWLADVELATQEVFTYESRDGLEIQSILMRPLEEKGRHPLVVIVHGGPESHQDNGWLTSYSSPGQILAARGYAVLYPNYRGSTGRGVEFSKLDQAGYARPEFDDLVDGAKALAKAGLVDEKKVGVTGGSYGGFASAWCATALSEHFAASVMFVGISDHVSKFGTTDIPNEMYQVHARRWPWDHWDWFRERSPIYHVEKARTPILIMHGEEDTRVHPSQSMELYRYLKTYGKVPVRLVMYPGEGHGNRKAAARYDYSLRLLRWMDHYLKGPGGDPPPHDLDLDREKLGLEKDDDAGAAG